MNLKRLAATVAALSLLAPSGGATASLSAKPEQSRPMSRALPDATVRAARQRRAATIAALRTHVKYVFVLYQENRSFDSYFGTFPGADGIYSAPAAQTAGFVQPIENTNGTFAPISPFRIGPAQYAADTDDVDHSHQRLIAKMDVTNAGPQMDGFALVEERKHIPKTQPLPTLQAKQYGELAMAHEDCDTIPLLWNYANRFVLFDHMFQSVVGPSTPGNIAIIAAQSGETQSALHPGEEYTDNGSGTVAGVPVTNDRDPAWGPYNPGDSLASLQLNLTFASLPLLFAGRSLAGIAAADPREAADFVDTHEDVASISARGRDPLRWGWFEEGYDREPGMPSAAASLTSYITHHNGPQYFGYIANSAEHRNLYGLGDFEAALARQLLPAAGGVLYVKGGFQNIHGLKPVDPDAAVQKNFAGDDDHPGYSDAQISEAQIAREVNLIASSKYWNQSAIVITWDDSEGDYDHVAPPLRSIGPGIGNAPLDYVSNGPRIPLMVVSPFAKTHSVQHAYGDQGSVVKLIEQTFGLGTLADLPDERKGVAAAEYRGRFNYGPDDGETLGVDDLVDAFDEGRLNGTRALLPPAYAEVPSYYVDRLPQETHIGCSAIGVVPVDALRGIRNVIPADFNPRPGTDPSDPAKPAIETRALVRAARDVDD